MALFATFLPDAHFGGDHRSCAELESNYERTVNAIWHYDIQNPRRAKAVKQAEAIAAQIKKQKCTRTVGDVFDEIGAALNTPRKLWDPYKK